MSVCGQGRHSLMLSGLYTVQLESIFKKSDLILVAQKKASFSLSFFTANVCVSVKTPVNSFEVGRRSRVCNE
jgi:hypothetical protein